MHKRILFAGVVLHTMTLRLPAVAKEHFLVRTGSCGRPDYSAVAHSARPEGPNDLRIGLFEEMSSSQQSEA